MISWKKQHVGGQAQGVPVRLRHGRGQAERGHGLPLQLVLTRARGDTCCERGLVGADLQLGHDAGSKGQAVTCSHPSRSPLASSSPLTLSVASSPTIPMPMTEDFWLLLTTPFALQIEAAVHAGVPVAHRGACWGKLLKISNLRRKAKFTYASEVEVGARASSLLPLQRPACEKSGVHIAMQHVFCALALASRGSMV